MLNLTKEQEKEYGVSVKDAVLDEEIDNTPNEFLVSPHSNEIEIKEEAVKSKEEKEVESSKDYIEQFIEKLPADQRASFYKVISKAGLREDDYLWTVLHIMGYVKTMYQDIPESLEEASMNIRTQAEQTKKVLRTTAEKEVKKLGEELSKKMRDFQDTQSAVLVDIRAMLHESREGIDQYSGVLDKVIKEKKVQLTETFVDAIRVEFPRVVAQHLTKVTEEKKEEWMSKDNKIVFLLGAVAGMLAMQAIYFLLK